jgi:hypothetical protein
VFGRPFPVVVESEEVMGRVVLLFAGLCIFLSYGRSLAEVETTNSESENSEEGVHWFLMDSTYAFLFFMFILTGHVWMWGLWWLGWKVATLLSSKVDEPLRKAMSKTS